MKDRRRGVNDEPGSGPTSFILRRMTKATSDAINDAVAYFRSMSSLQPEVGRHSRLRPRQCRRCRGRSRPRSPTPRSRARAHRRWSVTRDGSSSGHAKGTPVAMMQGRVHFYEGYEMQEVMYLSRVLGRLGIRKLIVTNAAGRHQYRLRARRSDADLRSHQSDGRESAARAESRRPRRALPRHERCLHRIAAGWWRAKWRRSSTSRCREGVYLALSGPTYETPAEIRAFRVMGARRWWACPPPPRSWPWPTCRFPSSASPASPTWPPASSSRSSPIRKSSTRRPAVRKQFTALVLELIQRFKS